MRSACAAAVAGATAAALHGATGTPARSASCLAAILSPSARIVTADGPRNRSPAAVARSAKAASHATKAPPAQGGTPAAKPPAGPHGVRAGAGEDGEQRVVIEPCGDLAARRGEQERL